MDELISQLISMLALKLKKLFTQYFECSFEYSPKTCDLWVWFHFSRFPCVSSSRAHILTTCKWVFRYCCKQWLYGVLFSFEFSHFLACLFEIWFVWRRLMKGFPGIHVNIECEWECHRRFVGIVHEILRLFTVSNRLNKVLVF